MNLTADRAKLLAAVSTVLHVAGSDARGLLRAANDLGCTLVATGNDGGAVYFIDGVTIKDAGDAVFALNSVAAVLRGLQDQTVDVERLPNSRLVVRTKSGRLELPTREASSIDAQAPESEDYPTVEIEAQDFRRAVARVAFAAERRPNPTSWATTGVLIVLNRDSLTMEATDRIGLALCRISLRSKATARTLLPVRTLRAWSDAARGQQTVGLAFGPSLAMIRTGPLQAWSPALNGTFPKTEDIFSAARPHRVRTAPSELLAAVELTMVAADPDEIDPRDRRLTLKATDKALDVIAKSEQATARFGVKASGYRGSAFEVPLSGRRVGEYLAAVESDEKVEIRWRDAKAPIEFATEDSIFIAMPYVDRED